MKKILERPALVGAMVAILLLIVAASVSIPMLDATLHYDRSLVHIQLDEKIALRNLWGVDVDKFILNGMAPSVHLKPIGYVMLILIHVGLPVLIGLRFYFAQKNTESTRNHE